MHAWVLWELRVSPTFKMGRDVPQCRLIVSWRFVARPRRRTIGDDGRVEEREREANFRAVEACGKEPVDIPN